MRVRNLRRLGGGTLTRWRILLVALVGVVVAAAAAGLAFAKARAVPVGTGVVVIETNLGYSGGGAAGTGIVVSSSGEVLTNNHVIRGATSVKVVIPGAGRSYTAKVVGYDIAADVAVLQASGASNLKTSSLGNSAAVKVGQAVTAVGNAGGTGSITRASGTVTGLVRSITVSDDSGGSESLSGLIEASAALQPGDSGGPLLDAAGKVVGMDTAASVGYGYQQVASSDGYAIPISRALAVARLIESGTASPGIHLGATAFLGVELAGSYGGSGVAIAAVVSGGPAAAAGLAPGDVITAVAGRSVSSPAALSSLLLTRQPGARVSISYRGQTGSGHVTTARLIAGPAQ